MGDPASGAVKTYCISTHVMMRTARATMETTTKAVMACFFWLAATTARRSACSQRAPTYPEWQLGKTGTSAHAPRRGLIRPAPQEDWTGETQALQKKPKGALPDLATGGKGVGKIALTPPHRLLSLGERGNSSAYHLRRQGAAEALCYHGYYARSWGSEEGSKCV